MNSFYHFRHVVRLVQWVQLVRFHHVRQARLLHPVVRQSQLVQQVLVHHSLHEHLGVLAGQTHRVGQLVQLGHLVLLYNRMKIYFSCVKHLKQTKICIYMYLKIISIKAISNTIMIITYQLVPVQSFYYFFPNATEMT